MVENRQTQKTRHQGVSDVIWGNSYRGLRAFLVAGFVLPVYQDLLVNAPGMETAVLLVMWAISIPICVKCAKKIKANEIVAGFAGLVAPILAPIVYAYLASNHKWMGSPGNNSSV